MTHNHKNTIYTLENHFGRKPKWKVRPLLSLSMFRNMVACSEFGLGAKICSKIKFIRINQKLNDHIHLGDVIPTQLV